MRKPSLRTVACMLLVVVLWAGVSGSSSAEPVGAEHGWAEPGGGMAVGEGPEAWGGCAMPTGRAGATHFEPCPLEWRMRALAIGSVGQAAEQLRRRLPVLSAIVAERGGNVRHWLGLFPWNGM